MAASHRHMVTMQSPISPCGSITKAGTNSNVATTYPTSDSIKLKCYENIFMCVLHWHLHKLVVTWTTFKNKNYDIICILTSTSQRPRFLYCYCTVVVPPLLSPSEVFTVQIAKHKCKLVRPSPFSAGCYTRRRRRRAAGNTKPTPVIYRTKPWKGAIFQLH